jgi:hypothetical protein
MTTNGIATKRTKPQIPYAGKWGFAYLLCGTFVSHASWIQRGLKNEKRENDTRMSPERQEVLLRFYWNDGILEK